MARGKQKVTAEQTALPEGVTNSDLVYPKWDSKEKVIYHLTFIPSGRFGWAVQTLWINQRQNRSYAATLDGKIITAGNQGVKLLHVYVRESRVKHFQKWLDAHQKGLQDAGDIRNRIGSRRAEGQLKRAQGLSSWRWDS